MSATFALHDAGNKYLSQRVDCHFKNSHRNMISESRLWQEKKDRITFQERAAALAGRSVDVVLTMLGDEGHARDEEGIDMLLLPAAAEEDWLCETCTLLNDPRESTCAACLAPRPVPPAGSDDDDMEIALAIAFSLSDEPTHARDARRPRRRGRRKAKPEGAEFAGVWTSARKMKRAVVQLLQPPEVPVAPQHAAVAPLPVVHPLYWAPGERRRYREEQALLQYVDSRKQREHSWWRYVGGHFVFRRVPPVALPVAPLRVSVAFVFARPRRPRDGALRPASKEDGRLLDSTRVRVADLRYPPGVEVILLPSMFRAGRSVARAAAYDWPRSLVRRASRAWHQLLPESQAQACGKRCAHHWDAHIRRREWRLLDAFPASWPEEVVDVVAWCVGVWGTHEVVVAGTVWADARLPHLVARYKGC